MGSNGGRQTHQALADQLIVKIALKNNISDDDQNGGDVQDMWPDQLHNYRCSKNIRKSYH